MVAPVSSPILPTPAKPVDSFIPGAKPPRGRFEVYERPKPGHYYAMGVDCALGIEGKDRDAAVLFDCDRRQVATLHGYWGETFADKLWSVIQWFGKARVFVVVEAAKEGIACARQLYDRGAWMYYHRQQQTPGRTRRDMLGHVPTQWDPTVQFLRRDIQARPGTVRDAELHGQLCKFGYRPRSKATDPETSFKSDQYTWGAPQGEHDDLVRAAALGVAGVEWLPAFEPPKEELPLNSIGRLLGYDKLDEPEEATCVWE